MVSSLLPYGAIPLLTDYVPFLVSLMCGTTRIKGKLITLSEPQFWVNLNALKGMEGINVSVGTEVEISNNFVFNNEGSNNKFYAIPTIAAKWTF